MRLMSGRFLLCLFDLPAILLLAADTVIFRTALYLLYTLQNSLYSVFLNFSAAFCGTCLPPGLAALRAWAEPEAEPCSPMPDFGGQYAAMLLLSHGTLRLRCFALSRMRPVEAVLETVISLLSLCCLFRMAAAGAAALTVISGSGLRCRCLLLSW